MLYNFNNLSFSRILVGEFNHLNGRHNVDGRPFAALAFRLSGRAEFKTQFSSLVADKGDISFIPQNVCYQVEYNDSKIIYCHLFDCNYTNFEGVKLHNQEYVKEEFYKLVALSKTLSQNLLKAKFYEILEKINQSQQASFDEEFTSAVKYMEDNFTSPTLSLPNVYKVANVSASSLYRKFYDNFGISPKQYLLNLRVNLALELLAKGKLSVKEIARQCGFSDEKYFSRTIKNRLGKSPSNLFSV